jgi:hypothetical protein
VPAVLQNFPSFSGWAVYNRIGYGYKGFPVYAELIQRFVQGGRNRRIGHAMKTNTCLNIKNLIFKRCTVCGFEWPSRTDFLSDPDIEMIGYQVHFEDLEAGFFLFNHSCKGTLSVKAGLFKDLYKGPIFSQRATGSEDCPGHCLYEHHLAPCPAECECAYVREVIQVIRGFHK